MFSFFRSSKTGNGVECKDTESVIFVIITGENMFETNQNTPERVLRFLIAVVLLPAPFLLEQNAYTIAVAAVGGILLFNALTGTCMTYKMFGVNTCKIPQKDT